MERKILKGTIGFVSVMMVLVLSFLYVFPTIHAKTLLQEEKYAGTGETDAIAESMEDYAQEDARDVVETDNNLSGDIKLELPEGILEDDIIIKNDYLTQTVSVKFKTDSRDYFSQYHLKGSCATIDTISYYRDGDDGVVSFALNQLYEVSTDYEEGYLYLTFIDPHDIYDKVVVIDAGHGSRAAGATMNDICEKDIDLAIVLELKKLFDRSDLNIGVYYTRLDDSNPGLEQRVMLANAAHADLFISIHNNASSNGRFSSLHGTQVLYSESDDSEYSSERFARICLEEVVSSCESRSIGILKGDEIYIIRSSEVPVALIEVGFMTNRDELALLNTRSYQAKAAEGIYNAIIAAFEDGF